MMRTVRRAAVRSDFDWLARLQRDGWDHNGRYSILRQKP